MSNLLEFHNENFGYSVATNGNFVAVGNPNSKTYDCTDSFSRIGEVVIFQKNLFSKNYDLVKKYKSKSSIERQIIDSYYTEISSSITSSIVTELNNTETDKFYSFNTCSFLTLEDGNRQILQNSYGKSLAMSDDYLAIGDPHYIEKFKDEYINGAAVDIFRLTDVTDLKNCSPEDFKLSDIPYCTVTGSYLDQFGKSVAVSNNYLAIGVPGANGNKGYVNVYKFISSSCGVELQAVLSSSDPGQQYFGSSLSINKSGENYIVVGTSTLSQSKVFIFERNDENWSLKQYFTQDTSSKWNYTDNSEASQFYTASNQIYTQYGHSVGINDNILIVGAPNDLSYYEYSGSNQLRKRGAFYFYYYLTEYDQFVLGKKSYGTADIFKDNRLGYSVDVSDDYFIVGSPKPYFPFSSFYLSESINRYEVYTNENDFGESTYNGQVLVYKWNKKLCGRDESFNLLTTTLVSYRKKVGEPFSAYGYSVGISNDNMVIGSPTPILEEDWNLSIPYSVEESSSFSDAPCVLDSYTDVQFFLLEDLNICDCNANNLNNECENYIIYKLDQPFLEQLKGRSFIYDFQDLETNAIVGNVFYNNNRFIFYNTGSVLNNFFKDPHNPVQDYIFGTYDSQLTLHEKQYICTVEPGEFNTSMNPTSITNSYFDYGIINKEKFDFDNLDIILRYINSRLTNYKKESWWSVVVTDEVQQSMFSYFTSSYVDFKQNKLTEELKCTLINKDFDINKDGVVDYGDMFLIWNYYIENLKVENYKQFLSPGSSRTNYDDIIRFLDNKTGKGFGNKIKTEFFKYKFSSSIDITGSYLAPYITTVGLYSGADLVAVGKLGNPIKNNLQIPINIVAKWDT